MLNQNEFFQNQQVELQEVEDKLTPAQVIEAIRMLDEHKDNCLQQLAHAKHMAKFVECDDFKLLLADIDKERLAVAKRLHLKQAKEGGVEYLVGLAAFEEGINQYATKVNAITMTIADIERDKNELEMELQAADKLIV